MVIRIIIFLIINFTALGIGSIFTRAGVKSTWYDNLEQAPWTPPGWAFGAAWTTIMICFAVYMAFAWIKISNRDRLITLFGIQWALNILWNPLFFYYHMITSGLAVITILTIIVAIILFGHSQEMKMRSWWAAPYFIWLCLATSLNAYILFNNQYPINF